jgi:glycosyltransferase involved in cell wall biosynthesis
MTNSTRASVILPAHNESAYLAQCLTALLASETDAVEVIVVANACTDETAAIASQFAPQVLQKGWSLQVIDTPIGGKLNALNLGDAAARADIRIYLDADVRPSPGLLGDLIAALSGDAPRFASGTPMITQATTFATRSYARFWVRLPFVTQGVPGFGIFGMNKPARARWGNWPDIISDDTFARLHATPAERVRVPATYTWPMVEGFANLVRVRRRQNAGVAEVGAKFPALLEHDDTPGVPALSTVGRFLRDPVGFCVYAAVALTVRSPLFRSGDRWARGR